MGLLYLSVFILFSFTLLWRLTSIRLLVRRSSDLSNIPCSPRLKSVLAGRSHSFEFAYIQFLHVNWPRISLSARDLYLENLGGLQLKNHPVVKGSKLKIVAGSYSYLPWALSSLSGWRGCLLWPGGYPGWGLGTWGGKEGTWGGLPKVMDDL